MKKRKIILFSFTALIICLVAVLSCVFINSFNKTENTDPVNSDLVVSVKNSEGITLKATRKYSINPLADDYLAEYVIEATVNDYDTSYDELVWELNFTCSDCCRNRVELEQGSLVQVMIIIHDYFEHQVTLTVSSKINPDVSATCLINCNQRSLGFEGSFDLIDDNDTSVSQYGTIGSDIDLTSYGYFGNMAGAYYFNIDYLTHITPGSIENDIVNSCSFVLSEPIFDLIQQDFLDDTRSKALSSNTINFNGMCSRGGISSESWNLLDFWCAISGVDMTLFNDPAYMESAYYYFGNNYSAIDLSEVHLGSFVFTSETVGPGTGEVLYSITQEFPIYIDLSDFAPRSINSITLSETRIVF